MKLGSGIQIVTKVENVFCSYFQDIFTSSSPWPTDINEVIETLPIKVTTNMNTWLSSPFTEAEIKVVLFQMHPSKASRSDGLAALFFQKFWDIVGDDLTKNNLAILN